MLGLDLPFSVTLTSSWGQKGSTAVVDIPLTEGGQDCIVTDADKVLTVHVRMHDIIFIFACLFIGQIC